MESCFWFQATAAVVVSSSYSIGVRMPRVEWRRRRLWKISMYSKIAFASSTRVLQRRVFRSSAEGRLGPAGQPEQELANVEAREIFGLLLDGLHTSNRGSARTLTAEADK